jgi:hypothetical protein
VYVLRTSEGVLVVVLYVDDLLIAGSRRSMVDAFKAAIAQRFKMKDLGALRWILGMEVVRDRRRRTVELKQAAYIDQILKSFNMSNCKPVTTPAEGVPRRSPASEGRGADSEYMRLVGSVLYASMLTRPDITCPVRSLSRHLQATGPEHRMAGKRLLRYLMGTRKLGIKLGGKARGASISLTGYSDSDWAGDVDTGRSTTGYVYMIAGGPVSWMSRLQPTVALSSTEAEYMAACEAVQEAVHLRQLLSDLSYVQDGPTVIFEDNQGCIALANNPVIQKRSKHINIKYHFTRERVESGEVSLQYIPTEHQLADLLTKPLLRARLEKLRGQVLGYDNV